MIIELKTAKYKGVEFLFTDMPTTGGNRLIKYNFPGSDKQAIERQGKMPRSYTLTAVIPHEDYYQQRDNLLRVLEDGEAGVLTHPTFGDVENVINGKYTLTEKLTEIGRAEIVIQFEVNDALGVPQQSGNLASQVLELNSNLTDQLDLDLLNDYSVNLKFSGNFADALENINNIADSMDFISEFAEPLVQNISDFRSTVNAFRGAIGNLIQTPADLAGEISGLFEDVNNLFETPDVVFGAFKSLFTFGDNDPDIRTNTVGRIQRAENRGVLRARIKTQSLGYAYLSAAQITYNTTDDLDEVQQILENQYISIRENNQLINSDQTIQTNQLVNNGSLLSNESLEILDRLRTQVQKTLDNVRVNTRTTINIETRLKPLSVLVYEYYGSTELVETIASLNNINQNAFVEGEIRILTI